MPGNIRRIHCKPSDAQGLKVFFCVSWLNDEEKPPRVLNLHVHVE